MSVYDLLVSQITYRSCCTDALQFRFFHCYVLLLVLGKQYIHRIDTRTMVLKELQTSLFYAKSPQM